MQNVCLYKANCLFLYINENTPNEITKSLADKIKKHSKKLKISQEMLAQKSGISFGSIKRLETKYENKKIAIATDIKEKCLSLVD